MDLADKLREQAETKYHFTDLDSDEYCLHCTLIEGADALEAAQVEEREGVCFCEKSMVERCLYDAEAQCWRLEGEWAYALSPDVRFCCCCGAALGKGVARRSREAASHARGD